MLQQKWFLKGGECSAAWFRRPLEDKQWKRLQNFQNQSTFDRNKIMPCHNDSFPKVLK